MPLLLGTRGHPRARSKRRGGNNARGGASRGEMQAIVRSDGIYPYLSAKP